MTPEELVVKIKEIKKRMRLTEGKLATRIGVDTRYISDILEGRVGALPWNVFDKIEHAVDDLDDL
ncbi:MAG: helix-turn-helix transcriptional regulator [Thermodesulfobacteriota bacterium]|nr:helix-turn-helix transcriptional regulator [Thermodesulfobacteriota bacterium]